MAFQCCENFEENERGVICPVSIALSCQRSRLHMPAKTFYETVCGWVVSYGAKTLTSQELCMRTEVAAFELDAPVGGDIFRGPKRSDPVAEEGTNDGLCFAVNPAGKVVDAEKRLTVEGREGSDQIKVRRRKWASGEEKEPTGTLLY